MSRYVLRVDGDEFVAAVEVLRRPELRGTPLVVGHDAEAPVAAAARALARFELDSPVRLIGAKAELE